jgi:hypothetical protein
MNTVLHIDLYSGFSQQVNTADFEQMLDSGEMLDYEVVPGDGAVVYRGEEDMFVYTSR